jgi:hypothetical protein
MSDFTLRPYAVPVAKARALLGDKAASTLYVDAARPDGDPLKLNLIKDGNKTLVTLESIERRQRALPPAKITAPRRHADTP